MNKILLVFVSFVLFNFNTNANASSIYVLQDGVNLGTIDAFSGSQTIGGNWNLNTGVDTGPAVGNNEGALFFYQGTDGLGFNILLNDGDVEAENGSFSVDMTVTGSNPTVQFSDDGSELYKDGSGVFHGNWQWSWGVDGGAIGSLDALWTINIFNIQNGYSNSYPNEVSSLRAVGTGGFIELDLNKNITLTNISAVPLPAGVWLFGTALAGIGFISRRRKQKS